MIDRLQSLRDEILCAFTILAGVFAIGVGLGERQMVKRYQAEAACPAGPVYRKVIDLGRMEVRCFYRERM